MSPNQCINPTKSRVSGSGRKSKTTGTIIVEIPNPVIVPTTLAKKVSRQMKKMFTFLE